jgi:hypothetical protein
MELEWVLSKLSLRGERCGCSPVPTNATRLVQKSMRAMLHEKEGAWRWD